jgi:hypothetical protein
MPKKNTKEGSKALEPTKWLYNNVINSCALTKHYKDKKEALTTSFHLYNLMISVDELIHLHTTFYQKHAIHLALLMKIITMHDLT